MSAKDAFVKFPKEASIIGMLLARYSDLEIDMMHSAQVVRNDLDTVLKTMFRARGETQRIEIVDAFGRQNYRRLGIGTEFEMALGAVRHCLKIRNQYSHCIWWDDNSGKLAFANLEEVASSNDEIYSLTELTTRYVDVPLLEEQAHYFDYADNLLCWVNFQGRVMAGELDKNPLPKPKNRQPPNLNQ